MIDKPNQNTTLRVCLEDVGTHNKAVLDFFFAKLGQQAFSRVSTQEEANVLIIDYDYPPARQRYEEEYIQWDKPAIVLSITPVELDNVIWLAKPLTSRALLDAAEGVQSILSAPDAMAFVGQTINTTGDSSLVETLRQERPVFKNASTLLRPEIKPANEKPVNIPLVSGPDEEVPAAEAEPDEPTKEEPQQIQQVPSDSGLSAEEQALRWQQLCGTMADIDAISDVGKVQSEDSFYLSSLKDAVRLARQCQQGVLLNFPQARIYILPEIHRVFCGIATHSPEFERFIKACNASEGGKMHILSTQEIHELNDMIVQQTSALYDLEAFVWTSSLLSAQGMLSRELDPSRPVALKHWPSLTRLERFPHVMPIAALWSTGLLSAFEVAKSLNVPQRYVFSFYNAASALGLIEQDLDKLIKKQPTSRTAEAPRGLFSRLLKRLIGG